MDEPVEPEGLEFRHYKARLRAKRAEAFRVHPVRLVLCPVGSILASGAICLWIAASWLVPGPIPAAAFAGLVLIVLLCACLKSRELAGHLVWIDARKEVLAAKGGVTE
jgi:hypothetical protein